MIPAGPDNINRTAEKENRKMAKCGAKTEIYSRVCGYFRPVSNWNKGKKEEFKDRKTYEVSSCSARLPFRNE